MPVPTRLDYSVIHVSDRERFNKFYAQIMGAELVALPGWAYHFGVKQLNVYGPGVKPAVVARLPVQPGNSDLCFEWMGPVEDAIAHLQHHGQYIFPQSRWIADRVHELSCYYEFMRVTRTTPAASSGSRGQEGRSKRW